MCDRRYCRRDYCKRGEDGGGFGDGFVSSCLVSYWSRVILMIVWGIIPLINADFARGVQQSRRYSG